MNKQKLTLLIALSTTIAILLGYMLSPLVAALPSPNQDIQPDTTISAVEEEPDPLEAVVEVVVEETPVIEEEIAAAPPVVEEPPVIEEPVVEVIVPQGEFAVARQVWDIMKSYGWSDEICAGIMGNMMRECGGDTLELNPYAQNSGHFGLCQWSRVYHYGAWNQDVAGQLEYLRSTLNIAIFEGCTTPEEVATIFHDKYERSGDSYRIKQKRLTNSRAAYNYFVG